MRTFLRHAAAPFAVVLAAGAARAQSPAAHLTVYDAGVAEVLEERTVELETGMNLVEWRSLMPKALVRTVRVTVDGAEVVRQDVSYDGAEVRGQRSPVLHLALRNRGGPRSAKVRVDYLAPELSWVADHALVLEPAREGDPPAAATLDSWVSLFNQTGTDVRAGVVDLVAGEISLLPETAAGARREAYTVNAFQQRDAAGADESAAGAMTEASGISVFSRFRLGRDIALNSNAPMGRHPLFQGARLQIVQRNVFENEFNAQTVARGGFTAQPRGLEVRLIGKNPTDAPMPAGQVTVYARSDGPPQVVGQDRVPLTPAGGEFTVSQGRSATLFGTRRVLERTQIEYRNEQGNSRYRLVTRVEVVLTNRGARDAEAVVREGVEPNGENRWEVRESSAPITRTAANAFETRLRVPAGGSATFTYTVETK
ncbi:MAG TPA: hypothetical protein VFQ39_01685 [Longimicrobium sp.]|nr:hypothetical protein [Longimicrobium sp.]